MHGLCNGSRRSYKAGCRCDLCKQAESEYKRDLRRRQREAVGEFVTSGVTLSLVPGGTSTSVGVEVDSWCGAVESAVALEIAELTAHPRPGLEAAAAALARILENHAPSPGRPRTSPQNLSCIPSRSSNVTAWLHRRAVAISTFRFLAAMRLWCSKLAVTSTSPLPRRWSRPSAQC